MVEVASLAFFSRSIYTVLSSQPLILTFYKLVPKVFKNQPAVQIACTMTLLQMIPSIIYKSTHSPMSMGRSLLHMSPLVFKKSTRNPF
jgi:hypothetical protein